MTTNTTPLALVIEDDAKQADIFRGALQMAGYAPEIVQDGNTALERLAESSPALIVLDLHLPHISGDKILKHIRADDRLANTRVMLATANPHLAETLREESDLVLIKPISFSQLRDLALRLKP